MFKRILILGSLAITSITSYAQVNYNAYKKSTYEWPSVPSVNMDVNPVFANDPAVCLLDETTMSIGNQKDIYLLLGFERHVITRFNTQEGINRHSGIQIPDSYDPVFDKYSTPFREKKGFIGPDYLEVQLATFAARIIKKDGSMVDATFTDEMKEKDVLSWIVRNELTYKYYKCHYWDFAFRNLEPGDILEVYYKYNLPYQVNFFRLNSCRLFFHGSIPKQQCKVSIKHHIELAHIFKFINGCEPDTVFRENSNKLMVFNKRNLPGCILEPGARPYQTLPYILYTINNESENFVYYDEYTSERKIAPYWLIMMRWRESYDYTMRKNAYNNVKDKQNALVDKFIAEKSAGIPDSNAYGKLFVIHSTIADSFKFVSDEEMFQQLDIRQERMGEYTAEYKVRETSRQKLYAKILSELKYNYFTLYISDNRLGTIDSNYLSPIWNNEYLYSILYNNSFVLMHPKRSDYGYYLEELPFYWENSTGILVNSYDLFYKYIEKPRVFGTAGSSLNDNVRMSNIMANVNLDTREIDFEARVSLSGQYSTMTRFIYTLNQKDSINNPLYNKKVSDIEGNVKVVSTEMASSKASFPYNQTIKSKFVETNAVNNLAGDTLVTDLKGWFNHVVVDLGKWENRVLDYYPDFVGQDTYRYFVKFSKPVKLVSEAVSVDLQNKFGKLVFKISQTQPDVVMIESYFVTVAGKISAADISDVSTIYKAISESNGLAMKYVVEK